MDLTAQASLVWSPHPLVPGQGRVVAFDPPTGRESLRAYLARCGVDLTGPVVVSINQAVVPVAWLDRVRPKPGALVCVRAAVAGGGDGSQVLSIIAMIALMVAAPGLGAGLASAALGGGAAGSIAATTFIAGTTLTAASIGTAVVTIAGAMAISALTPKPKMDLGKALGGDAGSPTYSLTGSSNRARPYEPLALTLGTHRVMFDMAAKPYSVYEGEEQYLYQVFHIGLHGAHPLRVEDLRIGDTTLSSYDGVTLEWSQDAMPALMPYNVDAAAGAEVTVADGEVIRTTSINTTRIEVDVQAVCYVAGNRGLAYREVAFELQYRPVSGGAWLPVGGGQTDYDYYWSQGFWESGPGVPQYNSDGSVMIDGDGQPLVLPGDPVWFQTSFDNSRSPGAHVDGVGGWRWLAYADKPLNFDAPPRVVTAGSSTLTLGGSSAAPIRVSYGIDVPAGQYEVRMARITPDETNSRNVTDLSWASLKSYQSEPGTFDGQTFLGLKIKASGQLSGTVATLSGLVSNPVADNQLSSNPADLFLQFARGYRNAAGRLLWGAGLADADLDLPAIAAWRSWCEAHALACNLHLDASKTVWDVLQAIARIGRASPTWAPGKLGVVWDAEDQPVIAMFGPSNIKRGSFSVAYQSGSLPEEVTVTYVDAAAGYVADQVRRVAPGVTTPASTASTELWGCTHREQAIRECNLLVAHQLYRTRLVSWVTDMEGLVVTRGDVVMLSHDMTQWGSSGRLVSGTATVLDLDRAITLDPAGSWVTVVSPEGRMTTCRVQYQAGEVQSITLLDPLPTAPDADSPMDWRWLCDYLPTPGKRVKIVDIKPTSMHEVAITAMDDPDEYYAAEWGTYAPAPVRKWTSSQPVVSALRAVQDVVKTGLAAAMELVITWTETGNIGARQVRYAINGGPVQVVPGVEGPLVRIAIPDSGEVWMSVDLYDGVGIIGERGHAEITHPIETLLAALEVELPTPLSPVIYCTPDSAGHISRARVRVGFAEPVAVPVSGLVFFYASFPFPNRVTIASGGTSDALVLDSLSVLNHGTLPVLAGSDRRYIVNTTTAAPNDVAWNSGGRYWARLPSSEWSKCVGIDETGFYFEPPFDVDPLEGNTLTWAEVAWADDRSGLQDKLAILTNGADYEVIRWTTLDDNGPGGAIRVTGCQRGQEGTAVLNADGLQMHYLPAIGPGTRAIEFPATAFTFDGTTYSAEMDLDFQVPPGQHGSLSAAIYQRRNDGTFARSVIVPATYGGHYDRADHR